jgi:hypothetical protein
VVSKKERYFERSPSLFMAETGVHLPPRPRRSTIRYWHVSGKPFALIQTTSRIIGFILLRVVCRTVTSKCHAYFSAGRLDDDCQGPVGEATEAIS